MKASALASWKLNLITRSFDVWAGKFCIKFKWGVVSVNLDIEGWARRLRQLALGDFRKEVVESAAHEVFGGVEIQSRTSFRNTNFTMMVSQSG